MIRVFPRKTKLTPEDEKVYLSGPPMFDLEDREVFVSVTFVEDKPKAERLAKLWSKQDYDVTVDGPAYDHYGQDFVPGRFVKKGAVITSRGCNNKCWFCVVPKREGPIREIPITDGFNILDSNLLQCSESHIRAVFAMLGRQVEKAKFTGGLEARLLADWHCALIRDLKPASMFFAYDMPSEWESLVEAKKTLQRAGIKIDRQKMFVYVLIGYRGDTIAAALKRVQRVKQLGFCPFAMLYSNTGPAWQEFQRNWSRPALIYQKKRTPNLLWMMQ